MATLHAMLLLLVSLLLTHIASHNKPAVSDFATDTAVADVIAAAGFFIGVSVVVVVSAVVSPPHF